MPQKWYISSEQVDYDSYISEISKYPNRNYRLPPVASRMLVQFISHRYLSAYQIFRLLKNKGKKYEMAYKNVHKRIKKLHSLNLIETVDRKSIKSVDESKHHPIYYRLTTGGIFYLIRKEDTDMYSSRMEKEIVFKT
jgi:hypothetical protein